VRPFSPPSLLRSAIYLQFLSAKKGGQGGGGGGGGEIFALIVVEIFSVDSMSHGRKRRRRESPVSDSPGV